MTAPPPPATTGHSRVAVVGTGFAGVGAAIALRKAGIDDFVLFERAGDVGGTWRDNTYPGCQCDVPSHLYSFSFAPNPEWSRTYSMQPEIGSYIRRTAERHDVLRHTRFHCPVDDARWDDGAKRWILDTPAGVHTADLLVMANGPLSEPKVPAVPGLDRFEGTTFHSAAWDHDHSFSGERVAVVGTGASTIQFLPHVQPEAAEVILFQRTPPWVLPHPDRAIRGWERSLYRRVPMLQKLNRFVTYWLRESMMFSFAKKPERMRSVEKIARRHLDQQVPDPSLRARLTPTYTPGCKRLLISNDYYPTLSEPNVTVVCDGIAEVGERSVVTADGVEHPVDSIIFGTGFHVTDNPVIGHIHGRDGRSLAEVWAETGMRAYKGATVSGFPNLFFLAGANTGIGHTSLVVMIEAQLRYLVGALRWMDRHGSSTVEVTERSLSDFNAEVQEKMAPTVWNTGGCASWYQDAHGRNPTLWPDFTWRFWLATRRFDPAAYRVERGPNPSRPGPAAPGLAVATG